MVAASAEVWSRGVSALVPGSSAAAHLDPHLLLLTREPPLPSCPRLDMLFPKLFSVLVPFGPFGHMPGSHGRGLPSMPECAQGDLSLVLKEVTFLGWNVPFPVSSLSSPTSSASLQTFWDIASDTQRCFWLSYFSGSGCSVIRISLAD